MTTIIAKRVSNYELFYDLVFVLAISSMSTLLHVDQIGLKEIFDYITANVIIMTIWLNETTYLNKYGERDLLDIFTIIPSMYIVGNLSLNFNTNYAETALPFNSFLTLAYIIIFLQYFLRGREIGYTEDLKVSLKRNAVYIAIFGLTTLAVLFKLGKPGVWLNVIFYLPLALSYFFRGPRSHQLINFPHLVERCQLITIITFGEMVINIIQHYPYTSQALNGFLLFFGMANLFIFYISQTYLNLDHHRHSQGIALVSAHMAIVLGLNFFTMSIEFLVDDHAKVAIFLMMGGLFLFYLGNLLTSRYNQRRVQVQKRDYFLYGLLIFAGLGLLYLTRDHLTLLFLSLNLLSSALIYFEHYRRRLAITDTD